MLIYLEQYVVALLMLVDIVTMGRCFLGLNCVLSLITNRLFLWSSNLGILLRCDLVVFHFTGHRIDMAFALPHVLVLILQRRANGSAPDSLGFTTFIIFDNIMVDCGLPIFLRCFSFRISHRVRVNSSGLQDASVRRLWFNVFGRANIGNLNFRMIRRYEPFVFFNDLTFAVHSLKTIYDAFLDTVFIIFAAKVNDFATLKFFELFYKFLTFFDLFELKC